MSGTTRNAVINVGVNDQDARRKLEALGESGQRSLERVGNAARAAQPGMQALASTSDALAGSISGLSARLGPLGAGLSALGPAGLAAAAGLGGLTLALRQTALLGDQFTTTLNRLQSATGSMQAAGAVYAQLAALSQQTGASIAESANAFARFSIAAREIGATNSQIVTLTRTVQQAGLIAGASTQEAAAGVLQLGQALASGRLQGDELRSILENMPTLAEALARELGVSIGQLRTMGSEGQLTSDRVFQALLRASEQINEQFDRLTPTMGRAFGALGQAMTEFVGRLDQALGLSQSISSVVTGMAAFVRGGTERFFPTEEARVQAEVSTRAGNIARLRGELPEAQAALDAQLAQFVPRNATPERAEQARQFALQDPQVQAQAQRLERLRRDLAEEQRLFREAAEARTRIEAEGAERTAAEQAEAEARRLEAQRRADEEWLRAIRERQDPRLRIEREYADRVRQIDERLASASIDAAEADRLRAGEVEARARALRSLEGAAGGAVRTTERLTEAERDHARQIERGMALAQQNRTEQERYAEQVRQLDAALEAARITQEQYNRAVQQLDPAQRAAREAAQRAAQEAEQQMRRQEQEAERTVDRITDFFGNSFARSFESTGGGFRSLMDSMRRAAISTFASIAAQAIIRPIIAPIVQGFAGSGLGSLFGIGGGGAKGAAGATGGFGLGFDQILGGVGLGSRMFGGGSLFGSGGMFGGIGQGVSNFLGTPLYTPSSAFSPSNFAALIDGTQASMTVTAGSALGALGGIGAGAFGIMSGIQKGGIGGAFMGAGGVAGIGAGLATLTGIGASLAPILGPLAIALPLIGMLLPGQRPSSKMQGVIYDAFGAEQQRNIGFDGAKFSAENRGIADQFAASLRSQESLLAGMVGFRAAGGFDLRVGDERGDGPAIAFEFLRPRAPGAAPVTGSLFDQLAGSAPGSQGVQRFGKDEAGLRALAEYASAQLFLAFQDAAAEIDTELASIVRNSANMEALTANLEFFNGAYRSLQDVSGLTDQWAGRMRDLRAPFAAAIDQANALGLATQGLADAHAAAVADAEARRGLSFDNLRRGLFGREATLAGDSMTAAMAQFDIAATQELQSVRDSLRDLGIVGEVAAETLLRTERILGEERLVLQREISERQNAAIRQSAQGVLDWLNSQRLGSNSTLSPFAQMQEAERQFRAAQEAGDLSALTRSADALLTSSRAAFGGATEAYAQREMFVRQTVANAGQQAAAGSGDASLVNALAGVLASLQDEIRTLNERMAEMAAQQRREQDRRAVAA